MKTGTFTIEHLMRLEASRYPGFAEDMKACGKILRDGRIYLDDDCYKLATTKADRLAPRPAVDMTPEIAARIVGRGGCCGAPRTSE